MGWYDTKEVGSVEVGEKMQDFYLMVVHNKNLTKYMRLRPVIVFESAPFFSFTKVKRSFTDK